MPVLRVVSPTSPPATGKPPRFVFGGGQAHTEAMSGNRRHCLGEGRGSRLRVFPASGCNQHRVPSAASQTKRLNGPKGLADIWGLTNDQIAVSATAAAAGVKPWCLVCSSAICERLGMLEGGKCQENPPVGVSIPQLILEHAGAPNLTPDCGPRTATPTLTHQSTHSNGCRVQNSEFKCRKKRQPAASIAGERQSDPAVVFAGVQHASAGVSSFCSQE